MNEDVFLTTVARTVITEDTLLLLLLLSRVYNGCLDEVDQRRSFTAVSHEILMEVQQLLTDVLGTRTILLLVLEIQQHVDLKTHTQVITF